MGSVIGLVRYIVLTAIFFYLLYDVIRAGVRDDILAADKRRAAGAPAEDIPSTSR